MFFYPTLRSPQMPPFYPLVPCRSVPFRAVPSFKSSSTRGSRTHSEWRSKEAKRVMATTRLEVPAVSPVSAVSPQAFQASNQ